MKGCSITAQLSIFATLFLLEVAARKRSAIDKGYIPDSDQNPTQTIKLLEFRLKIIEESIKKYSNTDKSSCPGRLSSTLNT